jgi:hypothetical protein
MKLRTCSAALVAITLGTSAWAESFAPEAIRAMNCPEETFVVQLCESDLTNVGQTASVAPELEPEADRIAAIVDRIAQSTVLIGIGSVPLIDEEGTTVASSFGSDPSEVTGSIITVEVALEGFEDR